MVSTALEASDLDQCTEVHWDSGPAFGEVQDFCRLDHTSCHFLLIDQERVIDKRVPVGRNDDRLWTRNDKSTANIRSAFGLS